MTEPDPEWLTVCEFERLFWEHSEHIVHNDPKLGKHGSWYSSQHPSRSDVGPGEKHTNEWLPLLILSKHEAGRQENWDLALHVAPSRGKNQVTCSGKSFDARYCFKSNNRGIKENRDGYLEITRGMDGDQSLELKAQDEKIARSGYHVGSAKNTYPDIDEFSRPIADAIKRKSQKAETGCYPDNTTLLVWLRHEEHPGITRSYLEKPEVQETLRKAAGAKFCGVCIVGISAGIVWVDGGGL